MLEYRALYGLMRIFREKRSRTSLGSWLTVCACLDIYRELQDVCFTSLLKGMKKSRSLFVNRVEGY